LPDVLFGKDGGHGMIFRDFSGDLLLSLHQPNGGNRERAHLFNLKEDGDRLALLAPRAAAHAAETMAPSPFPSELDRAAISVEKLDGILETGLLLGNGDLNGLLYTEKGRLVLRITKNDVWDARILTENDPPLPTLKRLKELSNEPWPNREWILPAGVKVEKKDSYHANAFPCPRACAVIGFGLPTDQPAAKLDIAHAVAQTGSTTMRALAHANAFLIHSPERATLEPIRPDDLPAAQTGSSAGVDWVQQTIPGDPDWPGMTFAVALAQEGTRKTVAVVTSREAANPVAAAVKQAGDTLRADDAAAVRRHETIWSEYWRRSGVRLEDSFLTATWYRNLYFLRCVTKPGVVSPGLFAGLTTDRPAWHGDYHTNYNLQQTFWTAYNTNHPELAEPYDQLIRDYLPRAQWLAKRIYDLNGAYYPHVLYAYEPARPEQCRSRNGRQYIHHVWGMTLGVTGFTVQPLWWHYKYAPSRQLLETTVYPAIREVALFYTDFADQCDRQPNGRIILGPSVSPEHHGWTPQFARNRDCAFDIAMVRYTLAAAIEGAGILERDAPLVARWRQILDRLPDYPTTTGQAPVVVDVAGAAPMNYNITVPTTPVFPGDVVTWWSPAAQKELFARTIEGCQWNGNNSTYILGVGRARLSLPGTVDWLRQELQARMRPNQLITLNRLGQEINNFGHYTEQFAASMVIGELLLQSVGDIIRVFPAWPRDKDASFANLRAQGGFLVTAGQQAGKVVKLEITSTVGGKLRLLDPWSGEIVEHGTQAGAILLFTKEGVTKP
jgi:hypothetical protein